MCSFTYSKSTGSRDVSMYTFFFFRREAKRNRCEKLIHDVRIDDHTTPIFSVRDDSVAQFNGARSLIDSTRAIDTNNARTPWKEVTAFEMCGSARHRGIECSESAMWRDPLASKKSQKLPEGKGISVIQGKR